ncbi:MAG: ADOP family duplicated permease [Bryobacteraceae bacterium]
MSEPPKFAEWLLRRLVGGRDADAVAGDLRETFEARGGSRLWYWWQAISCMAVGLSLYRRALPGIGTDFSRAVRRIRRNPGYALTAMLCLALALGVNTTLFSFLDSLYFRRLPAPEADRIVQIDRKSGDFCTMRGFLEFRDGLRSVQAAAKERSVDPMEVDHTTFMVQVEGVSANYPQVLRLGTTIGAWFRADANSAGDPEAVISYRLWQTRFGGDASVVGKRVRVLSSYFRIAGVGPREFTGTFSPMRMDVWVPLSASVNRRVDLIARLAPGATLANAAAELGVVGARVRAAYPRDELLQTAVRVQPASGFLWQGGRETFMPIVKLLSAVAGVVLLIACVNVANLLLSRAAVRRREMAIRQSLGASRARLFRETLAEGLVLAAGGLLLGILFGHWTGSALEWALPGVPFALYQGLRFGIDWRVALFLALAGIVCAILFSLPPALACSRQGLNRAIKGYESRNSRQREIYSVVQVALSLTLLIATGLLVRALDRVQGIEPGFSIDHRLFVNLSTSDRGSVKKDNTPLFSSLVQQARELPGVEDATLAGGAFPNVGVDCAAPSRESAKEAWTNTVDPNYFDLMGIPIMRGSGFAPAESSNGISHVIVNQTMARTFWPRGGAVGKTVWLGGCEGDVPKPGTVIGVARDAKYHTLNEEPQALYYVSSRQDPEKSFYALIVRTAGDPRQWTKPVLALVQRRGGDMIIYDSGTLGDAVARSLWEVKWQASLLAALGLLAIVLAAIGVYGVVACSVAQRTREIGVRMALGAAPLDVQWMVLAHGLRVTAIGIALGLLLSAATVRLLRGFLYGLSPFDPIAFAAASLAWIVIAMLASWYPAGRATRVDPMTALNFE